jgi:TRAP transporter TAXI family solute receptor
MPPWSTTSSRAAKFVDPPAPSQEQTKQHGARRGPGNAGAFDIRKTRTYRDCSNTNNSCRQPISRQYPGVNGTAKITRIGPRFGDRFACIQEGNTMLKKVFAGFVAAALSLGAATVASAQDKEIRWGTSSVGSSGHRFLVNLAEMLNKEWKGYNVTVQPTPGAIISVKGFATEKFEGFYGADIAFYEYANGLNRFKGFKENAKREPLQSMWTYTVEVGFGIHKRDKDKIRQWRDLAGKKTFTGPRPWDTRAQTERGLAALGIEHDYVEVDLGTAGSLIESGRLDAFVVYTNAESATAPWITEASLATDWIALNPSAEEIAMLKKKGIATTSVKPTMFKKDIGVDEIILLPFYYGFHVGLDVPADDVYRLLTIVEKNAPALTKADKGFAQIANDMVDMQRRGIESAVDLVQIHPGLAKYMKEKGAWDSNWDKRVAKAM